MEDRGEDTCSLQQAKQNHIGGYNAGKNPTH